LIITKIIIFYIITYNNKYKITEEENSKLFLIIILSYNIKYVYFCNNRLFINCLKKHNDDPNNEMANNLLEYFIDKTLESINHILIILHRIKQ